MTFQVFFSFCCCFSWLFMTFHDQENFSGIFRFVVTLFSKIYECSKDNSKFVKSLSSTQAKLNPIPYSPIDKRVFDVVACGVHKHATLVPRPALHANVLVDRAVVLKATVANRDGCSWIKQEHMKYRWRFKSSFLTTCKIALESRLYYWIFWATII